MAVISEKKNINECTTCNFCYIWTFPPQYTSIYLMAKPASRLNQTCNSPLAAVWKAKRMFTIYFMILREQYFPVSYFFIILLSIWPYKTSTCIYVDLFQGIFFAYFGTLSSFSPAYQSALVWPSKNFNRKVIWSHEVSQHCKFAKWVGIVRWNFLLGTRVIKELLFDM